MFEWDKHKAKKNKKKHGISFQHASKVFEDKNLVEKQDTRHDYGEDRFITVGSIDRNLITVINTPRNENIRIISAYPSSKQQKRWYQRG